ncbi:MAG: hypothetical protein HRU09_21145 [Oligoflexales bacterium]|nr:hypothetical protein [Oligoflexales bacterium]
MVWDQCHQEKVNLICLPGFSTKSEANEISGRGVGMDAVNQLLMEHGGGLYIESEKGKGSTFNIYLPHAAPSGESKDPSGKSVA